MSEHYEVTEPPTSEAYERAHRQALTRLSMWLMEEREKVPPATERWRTLAEVSAAMHAFLDQELQRSSSPQERRTSHE